MEAFDDELDRYYDSIGKASECRLCGEYVYEDRDYCSESCRRIDND